MALAPISWTIPDPVAGGFWLENPSRSGGVAQNGQEQVVGTLSMRQRAHWTVPVHNADNVKRARRFLAKAQGKGRSILVPAFEPHKGRTGLLHFAAAARDVQVSVHMTAGPAPEEGRHISIANRAYLITEEVSIIGSGNYTLNIFPPLRADAASSDPVLFDEAVCEMNLVEDQYPILLDVMRFAMLELEFVEAF